MRVIKEATIFHVTCFDDVMTALRQAHPPGTLDYTDDDVFISEAVYGVNDLPRKYPYILICNYVDDDVFSHIATFGVTEDAFVATDPHVREHLYEFRIRRTGLESPYQIRESEHQIPAKDIFTAYMELGQTFHKDEEYLLEVLSCKQVK